MLFNLSDEVTYNKVITKLSIYTILSVFGCILLGYIFLPLATAFYAALLVYENSTKRILSYVIPVLMFTLNFFIRSAFSFEAITYVALGVFLYYAAKRRWSKSESAVWMTILTLIFFILSAIFIAFELTGDFSALALRQFYSNLYVNFEKLVISTLTSLVQSTEEGNTIFVFSDYQASLAFKEIMILVLPLSILIAFASVGLSFKVFAAFTSKHSNEECEIGSWFFGASNLISYFYVSIVLLGFIVPADGSIFAHSLSALIMIFSVVFAYIAVRFFYNFLLSRGRGRFFSALIIIVGFVLLSTDIISILSYIGVFINVITNRALSKSN